MSQLMTPRRKLSIASRSRPTEGNIYGRMQVDVTQAQRYLRHLRETTGHKVTITHLVGKATGMAMAQAPGLNGRLLFGRYIPHDFVAVTYLVVLDGGKNLAKVKIDDMHLKSLEQVAQELRDLATKLREGKDEDFKKSQGPLGLLPTWIIRPMVHWTGWLTASLGLGFKAFGLEAYPFGSAVVTSVGMFGVDEAFAPQTPWARVPVWVLVGAIRPMPWVVDDEIAIRPIMSINATLDHRFIDGKKAGILATMVRDLVEHPWKMDGLEAPPWQE